MPDRLHGTSSSLSLAGLTTIGLMSGIDSVLHSDFRWLLVAQVLAWLGGSLLLLAETRR